MNFDNDRTLCEYELLGYVKKYIHLDAVNENPAHTQLWIQMSGIEESRKIFADEYLDDKNSTFYVSGVK